MRQHPPTPPEKPDSTSVRSVERHTQKSDPPSGHPESPEEPPEDGSSFCFNSGAQFVHSSCGKRTHQTFDGHFGQILRIFLNPLGHCPQGSLDATTEAVWFGGRDVSVVPCVSARVGWRRWVLGTLGIAAMETLGRTPL